MYSLLYYIGQMSFIPAPRNQMPMMVNPEITANCAITTAIIPSAREQPANLLNPIYSEIKRKNAVPTGKTPRKTTRFSAPARLSERSRISSTVTAAKLRKILARKTNAANLIPLRPPNQRPPGRLARFNKRYNQQTGQHQQRHHKNSKRWMEMEQQLL